MSNLNFKLSKLLFGQEISAYVNLPGAYVLDIPPQDPPLRGSCGIPANKIYGLQYNKNIDRISAPFKYIFMEIHDI